MDTVRYERERNFSFTRTLSKGKKNCLEGVNRLMIRGRRLREGWHGRENNQKYDPTLRKGHLLV